MKSNTSQEKSQSSSSPNEAPGTSTIRTHESIRPSLESPETSMYVVREDGEIIKDPSFTTPRPFHFRNPSSINVKFRVPNEVDIYKLSTRNKLKVGYKVTASHDSSDVYYTAITNWTRRGVPDISLHSHKSEEKGVQEHFGLMPKEVKPLITVTIRGFATTPMVRLDSRDSGRPVTAAYGYHFSANVISKHRTVRNEGFKWEKSSSTNTSRYKRSRDIQLVNTWSNRIVALFTRSSVFSNEKVGTLTFLDNAAIGSEFRAMAIVSQLIMIESNKRKFHPRAILAKMFREW
ncbi:hypothetical protein PVAG01_10273 [Phlyctema vagabunda]|uniref:Uncharacterized protein n=1 Tax=Phlyctema vagabunda TaxID=108571 RepID=A0ABR4P5M0_9HELO